MVAQADLGQPFKFVAGVDPARRVVGVAQDKESRPGGDGFFKAVEVDLVSVPLLDQRRIVDDPAVPRRVFNKMEVDGGWASTPSPGSA